MRTRLSHEAAEAIMLDRGFRPKVQYPGAEHPWLCDCLRCGKESTPRFGGVVRRGSGCRHCASVDRGIAQRANADEAVSLMITKGKVRPKVPYTNRKTPWLGDCLRCGKEVSPRLGSVVNGQLGCIYCVPDQISESLRLSDEIARKIMIDRGGVVPKVLYPGRNNIPWISECLVCKSEVFPTYSNVKNGHSGCKNCASSGFRPGLPARLYLISHSKLLAVKVGVTKSDDDYRINSYIRNGWEILLLKPYDLGKDAKAKERLILAYWRSKGYEPYLQQKDLPRLGYTETASIEVLKEWSFPGLDREECF